MNCWWQARVAWSPNTTHNQATLLGGLNVLIGCWGGVALVHKQCGGSGAGVVWANGKRCQPSLLLPHTGPTSSALSVCAGNNYCNCCFACNGVWVGRRVGVALLHV